MHLLTYRSDAADGDVDPESLPIWLVGPKAHAAMELTPSDVSMLCLKGYTAWEITHAGCCLSHWGLPLPIVNRILDLAGLWVAYHATTHEVMEGWAPMEREYVHLTIPHDLSQKCLRLADCTALSIECVSHDQGWAAELPEFNYTYFGCNSWVEFEILGPEGKTILPRVDLCRNFRACGSYRRHLLHITDRAILSRLVAGCSIIVYLRAQIAGWSNHAKYGRIQVQYAYAVDDSVDAADVLRQPIGTNSDKAGGTTSHLDMVNAAMRSITP
ncbi:Aste57867_9350 [Aphanomyces stellatus]|uniref:Aste57867_9350 protein n=1 Tax=Aphanomyces stellatus TaxID=120398 RepID=A0A485KMZ6_9STRA|nr:hypothetical protein As57867_009314 [Aphanomyces stellatus]VFT86231.1 Aste57867_9350 [Aphanomyces stellatus]